MSKSRWRNQRAALERIQFQHQSTLARALTEICRDMVAVAEREMAKGGSWMDMAVAIAGAAEMKTHLTRIEVTLGRELNLTMHTLELVGYAGVGAFGGIGVEHARQVNHMPAMVELSGLGKMPIEERIRTLYAQINTGSDRDTGRLNEVAHQTALGVLRYSSGMFMIGRMFANLRALTPEEHAAVWLHEIGHIVTLCEHFGRTHHNAALVRDSIRYLSETTRPDEMAQLIQTLRRLSTDGGETTKLLERAAQNDGPGRYAAMLAATQIFIEEAHPVEELQQANAAFSTKTTEMAFTARNFSYKERMADEFAQRHGLAAHAVSAQMLMQQAVSNRGLSPGTYARMTKLGSWAVQVAVGLKYWSFELGSPLSCITGEYDAELDRLKFMVQNVMPAFKDPTLPPQIRNELLDNTRFALDTLEEYRSQGYLKVRHFIWNTLLRLDSKGVLEGDYRRLQDLTAGLIRNPLYFQAANLQRLIER